MTETDDPKPVGKTRWRRVPLVLVPAYAAIAGLVFLAASGTLAVSFAISGTQFTTTADSLASNGTDGNGQGFYQLGVADFTGAGAPIPQVESIIPNATLTNLCQSVTVGPLTLVTKAGNGPGGPVKATNLVTDATSLSASLGSFSNFQVGQDMGTFTNPALSAPAARGSGPNVTTAPVPTGTFGQTAGSVTLTKLRSVGSATSASSFTVPDLSLAFSTPC